MNKNSLRLSVVVITYNHQEYITQAIESIVMQKTNFAFEIIIGEDCSTDGTAKIVKNFEQKNSNIKAHYNDLNLGVMQNFLKSIKECTGEYIAILEGDDYWIDPYKLQKQVDFLSRNKEYSLVFTDRKILKNGYFQDHKFIDDHITYQQVYSGFLPPTQTVVLRNNLGLSEFLAGNLDCPSGDRLVALYMSLKGPFKRLSFFSAVYRYSGLGVWSRHSKYEQQILSFKRKVEFKNKISAPLIKKNNKTIPEKLFYLNISNKIMKTLKDGGYKEAREMVIISLKNLNNFLFVKHFVSAGVINFKNYIIQMKLK